jgi:hypothetical protein
MNLILFRLKETKKEWVFGARVRVVEVWLSGLEDWGAEVGPQLYQQALNSLANAIAPQLQMVIKVSSSICQLNNIRALIKLLLHFQNK